MRTPRPATEPRDAPTGISKRNTQKIPFGPKFWNPKKIPRKYRKTYPKRAFLVFRGYFFGIFGVFWGYFPGGQKFGPRDIFFGIFCGNFGSGHLGGSPASCAFGLTAKIDFRRHANSMSGYAKRGGHAQAEDKEWPISTRRGKIEKVNPRRPLRVWKPLTVP